MIICFGDCAMFPLIQNEPGGTAPLFSRFYPFMACRRHSLLKVYRTWRISTLRRHKKEKRT